MLCPLNFLPENNNKKQTKNASNYQAKLTDKQAQPSNMCSLQQPYQSTKSNYFRPIES